MDKKYILFGSISIVIILLFIIIFKSFSNDSDSQDMNHREKENSFNKSINVFAGGSSSSLDSFMLERSKEIFNENGDWLREDDIFQSARKGELDLVSELWSIRRRCPQDYTFDQCQSLVRTFLLDQYGEGKLLQLFDKYSKFERELATIAAPENLSGKEKYEWLKELRRKTFSRDEVKLIFGMEEAIADYTTSRNKFLESTKNMSGDKRLSEYEKFKKKQLGEYYEVVNKREPKFQKYETELEIRSVEFSKLSSQAKEDAERALRIRYFDKEANARMEKVLADIQQEEKQEAALKLKEEEYIKSNPNISGSKLDEQLMKLRIESLGKAAAEEYTRRLEYENKLK